jgi:integrase
MPGSSLSKKGGRKPTGSVVEKATKKGTVFALRFRAYGNREYETLGHEMDGWTRELAEEELERRLAQVKLGQYVPPHAAAPEETDEPEPAFRELAWGWLEDQAVADNTRDRYRLDVRELVGFFGDDFPSQIDARRLDDYKRHMLRRRKRSGDPFEPETINKTIVRLGSILDRAKRYGYITANPVRERGVKLKARKPQRSYLDSTEQIAALLDAAKELDGEATRYRHVGRYAIIGTLIFGGPRLGELLSLRLRDVDLAGGWLRVKEEGDAKTEAGTRRVKIRPALRDILAPWVAHRKMAGAGPDDLLFPTEHGGQHSQSNVRNRIVSKAAGRADGKLDTPLPRLTPQSLRRTFASVLYAIGESPPVVMQEMGHTDPKLALRVYAEAMRRDPEENERLRALVNGEVNVLYAVEREEAVA